MASRRLLVPMINRHQQMRSSRPGRFGPNGGLPVHDDENQLIRVTITNATKSEFRYDGKMRRRERIESVWAGNAWVTNLLVRYVYDGNLVVQERHYVPQPFGEILQTVVSYTRGNDLSGTLQGAGGIGGLRARTDHSTFNLQPSTAYYHADGNGNVTSLTDDRNTVVARYNYDPYGNITASQGSWADANLYRFSSKEFHPQSELVYYLLRYYEPNLQRWMNRDPFEEDGGDNLFQFVGNNPCVSIDPDGGETMTLPCPPLIRRPPPGVIQVPGPLGIACACGAIGAAAIDIASKVYCDEKKEKCDQEWDQAFKTCREELSKPNPNRALTGGHNNIMDCARGLVTEECGGNPKDHGKKKKRRTIRFK
jgi:RHS repeat-associated protein